MTEENDFKLDVVSVRLVKDAPIYSTQPFHSGDDVLEVLGDIMCEFDREVICIVNLKSDMTPINVHFASIGALTQALVHPRELMKASILSNASQILMVHNHPSGNLSPSIEDTMITDRMIQVCALLGIPLVDHLIVGGDNKNYFSFKSHDMIKRSVANLCTDYRKLSLNPPKVAEKGRSR